MLVSGLERFVAGHESRPRSRRPRARCPRRRRRRPRGQLPRKSRQRRRPPARRPRRPRQRMERERQGCDGGHGCGWRSVGRAAVEAPVDRAVCLDWFFGFWIEQANRTFLLLPRGVYSRLDFRHNAKKLLNIAGVLDGRWRIRLVTVSVGVLLSCRLPKFDLFSQVTTVRVHVKYCLALA